MEFAMVFKDDPTKQLGTGIILPVGVLVCVGVIGRLGYIPLRYKIEDPARVCGACAFLLATALYLFAYRFLANYDHLAARAHTLRSIAIILGILGAATFMVGWILL